jgi:hypothetical protein
MEPETETLKVYSSYTEAQKRATKKYREQNKEKVNAQRKKYYDDRKAKDPNFLSYKREKAKEYYIKKKGIKTEEEPEKEVLVIITNPEGETTDEEISVEEVKVEEPETPVVVKEVKPKAPRKPRLKKESTIKENIKPEDLEELKAELIKSFEEIEIVHNEPLVPHIVIDTIDEHTSKKSRSKEPKTPKTNKRKTI